MNNRRNLLKLAALVSAVRSPLLASPAPALANTVIDPARAKLSRESFGELRVFFEGPTAHLKSMTAGSLLLKPGREPHPPHSHPEEEFMVITEGTGEIVVAGVSHPVAPGSMMFAEANQLHGIKNTGSTALLFYYYKWLT